MSTRSPRSRATARSATELARHELARHHHRPTQARLAILATLAPLDQPVFVNDLISEVTDVPTSTVYATLRQLVDWGLVSRLDSIRGRSYYCLPRRHDAPMLCAVCTRCGHLTVVDPSPGTGHEPPARYHRALTRAGITAIERVDIYGVCRDCAT